MHGWFFDINEDRLSHPGHTDYIIASRENVPKTAIDKRGHLGQKDIYFAKYFSKMSYQRENVKILVFIIKGVIRGYHFSEMNTHFSPTLSLLLFFSGSLILLFVQGSIFLMRLKMQFR